MPSLRPRPARALASAALLALAACGDDPASPDNVVVLATAAVQGEPSVRHLDDGTPYLQCVVQLGARATGTGTAQWTGATLRWYTGVAREVVLDSVRLATQDVQDALGGDLTISAGESGTSEWVIAAPLPFWTDIQLRYRPDGGSERTATATFRCGPPIPPDPAPPAIASIAVLPEGTVFEARSELQVTFTATSPAALWQSAVTLDGACDVTKVLEEPLQPSTTRVVLVPIPESCRSGVRLGVTVSVLDGAGRTATRRQATTLQLADFSPPRMDLMFFPRPVGTAQVNPSGDYTVGESIQLMPNLWDASGSSWLVWEVQPSGARDSVLVPNGTQVVGMRTTAGWVGGERLRVFARDLLGQQTPVVERSLAGVRVGAAGG